MTTDQYSSLIEFLGLKFDAIDQRFERAAASAAAERAALAEHAAAERAANLDQARRHASVLFEQSQAHLNVVAEGLILRLDSIERALREGLGDHEQRLQVLEQR